MIEAYKLIAELAGFINRWPGRSDPETWKRFRLAVTQEEFEAIVNYYREDSEMNYIAFALRGVPLQIETDPTKPSIVLVPK